MAYPTLNSNEIYAALSNQIISQRVYADNVAHAYTSLIDANRVDGTLYGDTKTYTATDVLKSYPWGADAEANNLLKIHRAKAPDVQTITLDTFRQIPLTVDNYLTKRAWSTEGAFADFNNTLKTWISDTRKIHETTTFNSFLGTHQSKSPKQNIIWQLPAETTEESRRIRAQDMSANLADLFDALADYSRDFNDFGNLRSFDSSRVIVVWNAKYLNAILKKDLPTTFHDEVILQNVTRHKLPARYFGTVKTVGGTANGTTIRSLIEKDYNSVEMDNPAYDATKHVFPGDLIPKSQSYLANEAYEEDATIICKIIVDNAIPFMTSMAVATDFFNSRSLTDTLFLTFGYNTLVHLMNYPMITVRESLK